MTISRTQTLGTFVVLVLAWGGSAIAAIPPTPEAEALKLDRSLKGISDLRWKEIAGERSAELYQIVKGDTLFDVSKRFFGDGKYWPKIWAINNGRVLNPHLIYPGNQIAFNPGSGLTLPTVAVGSSAQPVSEPAPPPRPATRSSEYKDLPLQRWEEVYIPKPLMQEIDPLGFDKRSRVSFAPKTGLTLRYLVADEEIQGLGRVRNARVASKTITLGDQVYIRSEGNLQVGEEYTISESNPQAIKGLEANGSGYFYPNLGTVMIKGVRGEIFVGEIIEAFGPISRDDLLVTKIKRIQEPVPVPGKEQISSSVILDHTSSLKGSAQYKYVFLDRGSEDGIQPGNVFRSYIRTDPATEREFTESNLVRETDFLVLQTSQKMAVALAVRGADVFNEKNSAFLLTDVAAVAKELAGDRSGGSGDLDELDKLDTGPEMSEEERRELEQLEQHQGEETAPPTDETAPPAEGDELPPPDSEAPPVEEDAGLEPPSADAPPAEQPPVEELPPAEEVPPADAPPAIEEAPPAEE